MLRFKQFLMEAIVPMAGDNTGFKEVHEIEHGGKQYHAVVNFVHHGEGKYKVIARTGEAGKVGFKHIKELPPELSRKLGFKIAKSVENFRNNHDWNSLSLGGIDKHTKEVYQKHARTLEATSGGTIKAEMGSTKNPVRGAVVLHRTNKIEQPKLSGHAEPDKHAKYDKKSSGDSSSSSSSEASADSKSNPFTGKWGLFNPSGKKKKGTSDAEMSASSFEGLSSSSAK